MRLVFSHEVATGYEPHAPATSNLTLAGSKATVPHLHCYNMHSFFFNIFFPLWSKHTLFVSKEVACSKEILRLFTTSLCMLRLGN